MPAFLYRCPNSRLTVQGFVAEEVPDDAYQSITCLACRQNHFVNPTTGKVLGEDEVGHLSVLILWSGHDNPSHVGLP